MKCSVCGKKEADVGLTTCWQCRLANKHGMPVPNARPIGRPWSVQRKDEEQPDGWREAEA